jgi:hypothetical protein
MPPLTHSTFGALDHDKYAKVGGGENFLLEFRKVGGRS